MIYIEFEIPTPWQASDRIWAFRKFLQYTNIFEKMSPIDHLKHFLPTMHFIGRVTLFFANNYLTEYWITMEF